MENKFLDINCEDAVEYAKYILSNSSSIEEIEQNIDYLQNENNTDKVEKIKK